MNTVIYIISAILLAVPVFFFIRSLIRRETRLVEINRFCVPVGAGKIKKALTFLQISDLHVSPWFERNRMLHLVERINAENPDYIFITGDFVTHFREYIALCGEIVSKLRARKKVAGVPGNHDYWVDIEYIMAVLEESGVEMLRNRGFYDEESGLYCCGVDDPFTDHEDLPAALKEKPEHAYTVLLSHSPDIFEDAVRSNVDLVLSGHTHGGQVRFPVIGAVYVPTKTGLRYSQGWFRKGEKHLYVNRGLGVVFPPYRFLCKREITILNLVPEDGEIVLTGREVIDPDA